MKFIVKGREVESYQLTNEEVLDLLNGNPTEEERDKLMKIVLSRFKSDLCPEKGEDEDDVFVRFFSSFVNGKIISRKKVGENLAREHRYLQEEMFKVCLEYIKALAENYEKGYYDGRNEWSCMVSSKIKENLIKLL